MKATATTATAGTNTDEILHNINGIICREVKIEVKKVGSITIMEATAASQDELLEMACATEEEIAQSDTEHLIITSGDPYGAVLWPAASAVSDHLLTIVAEDYPSKSLDGLTILELGTGTGLCSLAAALGGASKVMATDFEQVPLRLLEFAASSVNREPADGESEEDRRLKLSKIETCKCTSW